MKKKFWAGLRLCEEISPGRDHNESVSLPAGRSLPYPPIIMPSAVLICELWVSLFLDAIAFLALVVLPSCDPDTVVPYSQRFCDAIKEVSCFQNR